MTTETRGAQRTSEHYTAEFFEQLRDGCSRSAEVIVPIILQLLPVRSAVDVGCGEGVWLSVFRKLGVEDVFGIDGDYIARTALKIPETCFRAADLSAPLSLDRTFDLAVSLEVAEHLTPESAPGFVESLTRLAPAVLFSAAIPFQGGTNHVNEQWPEYWAELFRRQGYITVDTIRRRVWRNDAVESWYAQNSFLFVEPGLLENNEKLRAEFEHTDTNQLSIVHPRRYVRQVSRLDGLYREAMQREAYLRAHPASGVRQALRILWQCIKNAVRVRMGFSLPVHPRAASDKVRT